ncbi:hypothetical protein QTP88_006277 [Uroleucon formosanum]
MCYLCSEMGSDHIQLLLYTELFLGETQFELKDKYTNNQWRATLAYLLDMFNRLNFFPNLEQFMTEHKLQVEADGIKNIKHHCKMLNTTFKEYFKEDYYELFWIRNPLILYLDDIPRTLTNNEKESLIKSSYNESLKMEFTKLELGEFWIKIKNEYPLLCNKALLFLLPFTTTIFPKLDSLNDRIPVPGMDQDSANIIAIVTEQKNELNRLGTKHGLIKGWFNSSTLQPATSNFSNMAEVNKAKELSLREIVASKTGGQGFHSCN